jgi:hypothetical protein
MTARCTEHKDAHRKYMRQYMRDRRKGIRRRDHVTIDRISESCRERMEA